MENVTQLFSVVPTLHFSLKAHFGTEALRTTLHSCEYDDQYQVHCLSFDEKVPKVPFMDRP